jgi:hypothetical protein
MVFVGDSLAYTENQVWRRGKLHGDCYVIYNIIAIYHGYVQVTSMKFCFNVKKKEEWPGHKFIWIVLNKFWKTAICMTLAFVVIHLHGETIVVMPITIYEKGWIGQ